MRKGTFQTGTLVAIQGSERLGPGAVVECTGTLSGFMMQLFPLEWLESGLSTMYGLQHSDVRVLAVELNPNGTFRMQVTPTHVQQAGIGIAVAIAAGAAVTFLAGLQVEYMYLVVKKSVTGVDPFSGGGSSPLSSAVSGVMLLAVLAAGVWIWGQYKAARS